MQERLEKLNVRTNVETFNSFCEKILRKYEAEIYGREMRIMGYKDKINAVMIALSELNLEIDRVINNYFSEKIMDCLITKTVPI